MIILSLVSAENSAHNYHYVVQVFQSIQPRSLC